MSEALKVEIDPPEGEVDEPIQPEEKPVEAEKPEEKPEQSTEQKPEEGKPDDDQDSVDFNEKQQAKVNDIIGKKTAEKYELKRQLEDAQKRLEEMEKKIPQETRPDVPDLPDPTDPDYEAKVKARDETIRKAAEYDANEKARSEAALREQQETQRKQMEQFQKLANGYQERAEKLGISTDQLAQAGERMKAYPIGPEATVQLLNEPLGPQIFMELSRNPLEAEKLAEMSTYQKAVYIENTLKPRAEAAVNKAPDTPEPPEHLTGKGAPEGELGPKGTTFE